MARCNRHKSSWIATPAAPRGSASWRWRATRRRKPLSPRRAGGGGWGERATAEGAKAAIAALNGKDVEGRALTVNEARPKTEGGGRGGCGGGGRGGHGGGGCCRY